MVESILLVKTSSLGDVIHALPALSDMRARAAGARIDWVIEESLSGLPRMHPAVGDVISIAMRRWRRSLWLHATRSEISGGIRRLRGRIYGAIIDAQGLLKSALIARWARGPRYGMDFHSAREPLAVFYDRAFRIPWTLHAVERTRLLAARALGYEIPERIDYGIRAPARHFDWLPGGPYAVLLHMSSGRYKLWDEQNWIAIAAALNSAGLNCVLPWGADDERDRSTRLGARLSAAVVPPALAFAELAGLFAGARVVVGLDTGLTHLAAALGVPTVGIYCGTDPAATGIYGCPRARNLGGIGRAPSAAEVSSAIEKLAA